MYTPKQEIIKQPWPYMDREYPDKPPGLNKAAVTVRGLACCGVNGRVLAVIRQPAERDTGYWTRRDEQGFHRYVREIAVQAERANTIPIGHAKIIWHLPSRFAPVWMFWKKGA